MSAEPIELARLVEQHRPKVAQSGFPPWLRERIAKYVGMRHGQGTSFGVLAAEIGISRTTLAYWSRSVTAKGGPTEGHWTSRLPADYRNQSPTGSLKPLLY
jgi:hypothetical protein